MSNRVRVPKELRREEKAAKQQGWTITRTKKCHLLWLSPSGARVITGSTPGRFNNAIQNARAAMEKAGLIMEEEGKGNKRCSGQKSILK